MIPMSCPNCGSQGKVPPDRLNSRLKCRKCGTMFYMDETGSIMLGDPNASAGRRRGRKAAAGPAIALDFDLGRMVKETPKPMKVGGLAVAALALLGFGVSALMASLAVPEDVAGRSAYVGELFVDNKVDRLRNLAAPGTAEDLATWHRSMRPKFNYEGPRRRKRDVMTSAAVGRSGDTSAQTYLSLVVSGAMADTSPSTAKDSDAPRNILTVTLAWTRHDGVWLVDGTKTLAEAKKFEEETRKRGSSGGRRY